MMDDAQRERRLAHLGANVLRILVADDGLDLLDRMDAIRRVACELELATMHDGCDDRDPYLDLIQCEE